MILEVDPEAIRDIAAAVNAARKREPKIDVLLTLERKVLQAIQKRSGTLELEAQEGQAMRNILLQRAFDQRNTPEAEDYSDLAERILGALEEIDADVDVTTTEP
jgi:hypothetical protein